MPTRPEASSGAAEAASAEAGRWLEVLDAVPEPFQDVVPTEAAVIGFHDPGDDLDRRAARWTHRFPDHRLESLASFGAGLATAEAEAWQSDQPHVATQAYADRRFFAGDRVLHWAIPWLDAVGRCYPEHRGAAHRGRDTLLAVGDALRPAPDLGVEVGAAFGEDAYGPIAAQCDEPYLRSLWSGALLLNATVRSIGGGSDLRAILQSPSGVEDLAELYTVAAARWKALAGSHPGTASLWSSLSNRATRTSHTLGELMP